MFKQTKEFDVVKICAVIFSSWFKLVDFLTNFLTIPCRMKVEPFSPLRPHCIRRCVLKYSQHSEML